MPVEVWWLLRVAGAVYIAWRAVILLDVQNPLMAIMCAIVLCVSAPIGLEILLETYGEGANAAEFWEVVRSVKIAAPLAFALLGVFAWAGIESAKGT
jgi:hypothetical protein